MASAATSPSPLTDDKGFFKQWASVADERGVEVPYGVDAGHAGPHPLVDRNPPPVGPDPDLLEPESLGEGTASRADEDLLRDDLLLHARRDGRRVSTAQGADRFDCRGGQEADATGLQYLPEVPHELDVQVWQYLRQHLDDGDLHA
mgnify:CR=1 FL=1